MLAPQKIHEFMRLCQLQLISSDLLELESIVLINTFGETLSLLGSCLPRVAEGTSKETDPWDLGGQGQASLKQKEALNQENEPHLQVGVLREWSRSGPALTRRFPVGSCGPSVAGHLATISLSTSPHACRSEITFYFRAKLEQLSPRSWLASPSPNATAVLWLSGNCLP